MDQTTYEVRLAHWKTVVERCQARPEGQSARQWLADNGISDKQYYYWLRRVRTQAYSELKPNLPSLAEVQPSAIPLAEIPVENILNSEPVPAVVIKTRKSTIEISSVVSEAQMVRLVKAVAHAL